MIRKKYINFDPILFTNYKKYYIIIINKIIWNDNLLKTFVCEAPIAIEAREKVTQKLTPLDRFDFYDTENVYC